MIKTFDINYMNKRTKSEITITLQNKPKNDNNT
jgi:hypothetical protein